MAAIKSYKGFDKNLKCRDFQYEIGKEYEMDEEITSPEKIKTSMKDNSSGNNAQIGSSGNYAKIGSSGNYAKIGSSGYYAKIGSSGNYAKIGSSGDDAQIDSTGEGCVIMCAGINSVAKASKGSWITLSEWSYSDKKQRYIPVCVKTEFVDGEKIKADTYYKLAGGVFKEIQ